MEPTKCKKSKNQEMEETWKQKVMHGQFVRDKEEVNWDKSWQWLAKGDLKGCTEALLCSAQEQALRIITQSSILKWMLILHCAECAEKKEKLLVTWLLNAEN